MKKKGLICSGVLFTWHLLGIKRQKCLKNGYLSVSSEEAAKEGKFAVILNYKFNDMFEIL